MTGSQLVRLAIAGMVVFGGAETALADTIQYSFTTIDVPGDVIGTFAEGTNRSGQIVGYFLDSSYIAHGFLDAGGSFTTTPFVGSGINDSGQIVGTGGNSSLLYSNGGLTLIHYPGSINTYAQGINNNVEIVGWFFNGEAHGFLSSGASFTTIDYPNAIGTYAQGISDGGQIVGYFRRSSRIIPWISRYTCSRAP